MEGHFYSRNEPAIPRISEKRPENVGGAAWEHGWVLFSLYRTTLLEGKRFREGGWMKKVQPIRDEWVIDGMKH